MATKKTAAREASQQRLAAARAAQAKVDRTKRIRNTSIISVVVVVVLAVIVTIGLTHKSPKSTSAAQIPASSETLEALDSIPAANYATVGEGTGIQADLTPLSGQPALTADGKPRILYIGAEYCPYCAAERWAVVTALNRFGSFSNLGQTESSSVDVYPSTPTLAFHGATYTSAYVSFTGYEQETNQSNGNGGYTTLDTVSSADQKIEEKYNAAPYVPSSDAGSIPFVDFGNQYLISGASYSPQLLAGKSPEQVAKALDDPSSPITKAVLGMSNHITAAICKMTGDKPANVCAADPIPTVAAALPTA